MDEALKGLVDGVLKGEVQAASRLMRRIEDGAEGVEEALKAIFGRGSAHVVGITGPPGVGKSTLVDRLIGLLRGQGREVGVLAVDPSSPLSGGALLGDRVRMQRHATDRGVFIRSVATRGQLGGLSRCTYGMVRVLEAMGKEVILLETVGVGQDEVDVARAADTTVVVLMPGMGDDVQAIKAGLLEVGDIFVINKRSLDGADRLEEELRRVIEARAGGWTPPVYRTEALSGEGVEELLEGIARHGRFLRESGLGERRRRERAKAELVGIIQRAVLEWVLRELEGELEEMAAEVAASRRDPHSLAEEALRRVWGGAGDGHMGGTSQGAG